MSLETNAATAAALQASERMLSRAWRLIGLRGAVAIIFAVVLLIWPGIGLTAMVWAVGLFAIVSGFVSLAGAFSLSGAAKRERFWLVAQGVAGIVCGAVVLLWPGLSATALLYVIALWAIAAGVIEVLAALVLPLSGPRTALVALGGIILTAFGIAMFVEPGTGAIGLLALVAAFALVRGASDVALAVQLRHVSGDLDRTFRPLIGTTSDAHA